MTSSTKTTIGHVLKTVFPDGTQFINQDVLACIPSISEQLSKNESATLWDTIPLFPFDVFAFCAHLIEITGLMGFFDPDPFGKTQFTKGDVLKVVLSVSDKEKCYAASKNWSEKNQHDDFTVSLWQQIIARDTATIRIKDYQKEHKNRDAETSETVEAPDWWRAAFQLLIIADEACDGVGHFYSLDESSPTYSKLMPLRIKSGRIGEQNEAKQNEVKWHKAKKQFSTLAAAADRGVVCVQPKGRVSDVGCSLRNLSRNLAITGPVGAVRCSWQQLDSELDLHESDSLNLLMIPLPFKVAAKWYRPVEALKKDAKWGNFEIEQKWIPEETNKIDEFSRFVMDLIEIAQQDVEKINGIIFPEYALNYPIFEFLLDKVFIATKGKIEFMISGSSSNCNIDKKVNNKKSNCVVTALWEQQMKGQGEVVQQSDQKDRKVRVISQRKHHRWKLNETQIKDYGLASSLPPYIDWWENHDIDEREINFFQFRKNAVFASLICEDLARNDPCHDIIRSVAPNLIIALLMDGPQLSNRWSARYAGTLADDPGSTVLTLTSRGLLNRTTEHTKYDKSSSIGLVRDDTGRTEELIVEDGNHALVVTLASRIAKDFTIDGRKTTNASSWHYVNQRSIKAAGEYWDIQGVFTGNTKNKA